MSDSLNVQGLQDEIKRLQAELKAAQFNAQEDLDSFDKDEIINDFKEEFEKIKNKTEQISVELSEQIREKPLQSVGIAFALGIALSIILGSRR